MALIPSHQQAFETIKKVIGTETQVLFCYLDFNKRDLFHLYTDASDHQSVSWGQSSCRIKSKTTIAFYSRKLNTAQKRYTTTESYRELLSAIETCKEYKNILLGYHYPIIVFTDHKDNTFNGFRAIFQTAFCVHAEFYFLKNME
jgi:hypothetical protein